MTCLESDWMNPIYLATHSSNTLRDCHLCFTQGISKGKFPHPCSVSDVGLQHQALQAQCPAWLLLQAQPWGPAVPPGPAAHGPLQGFLTGPWLAVMELWDNSWPRQTHVHISHLRKHKDRYGFFFWGIWQWQLEWKNGRENTFST